MDIVERFAQAVAEFGARVEVVGHDQWGLPTPNAGWDVRAVVNHVVSEELWAPPLFGGATLAEVGDRFEGDVLGADPVAAWRVAAAAVVEAARQPGLTERTVGLSFGETAGADYLGQLITDHVIHGWDVARATGGDESVETGLVEFVFAFLEPQVAGWRVARAFGPALEVPAAADRLTKLLALSGRARF